MNADLSLKITHNVIIADRSQSGIIAVASILETCPAANESVRAWHNSTDRFFMFTAEHETGRIGSVTARDIDHLLSDVLHGLFLFNLKPPARAEVDVFCQEPDNQTIHDRIDKLLIVTAFDAGSRIAGGAHEPEPRTQKRERKESTPTDLSRTDREKALRYLCRMWIETMSAQSMSVHQLGFSGFENWLKLSGFSHYLVCEADRYFDMQAETWFSDELSRIRRAKS